MVRRAAAGGYAGGSPPGLLRDERPLRQADGSPPGLLRDERPLRQADGRPLPARHGAWPAAGPPGLGHRGWATGVRAADGHRPGRSPPVLSARASSGTRPGIARRERPAWAGSRPAGTRSSLPSGAGSHQFALPNSATIAGTSRQRTTTASTRMPAPRPVARIFRSVIDEVDMDRNDSIRIAAALVTSRPVRPRPSTTAWRADPVRS